MNVDVCGKHNGVVRETNTNTTQHNIRQCIQQCIQQYIQQHETLTMIGLVFENSRHKHISHWWDEMDSCLDPTVKKVSH